MKNDWMMGAMSKGSCHTGNPLVFTTDDGIEVYAGGHSRNGGWHRMSPAPDLAIGPAQVMGSSRMTTVPDGFSCAQHITADTSLISIDWPDFSIPQDVHREWWVALVDDIRRLGLKRISTQCVGGHGRTGVQLCILANLMGVSTHTDSASLIKWVRDSYCHHAVEGFSQQRYVAEVLEIDVGDDLFPVSVRSSVIDFADIIEVEDEKPKRKKKGNKFNTPEPRDDFFFEDEPEDIHTPFPDDYSIHFCECCPHFEWVSIEDDAPAECKVCGSKMNDGADLLYMEEDTCHSCGGSVSPFGISYESGRCLCCEAEDAGVKTRSDGTIQCKKCKKYHIPEFIMERKKYHCATCVNKGASKKKGKKGRPKVSVDDLNSPKVAMSRRNEQE
tara:strand:- start:5714 stop:6871 length:1158 start_codon:yes stop_codon:yes gene_type:complete